MELSGDENTLYYEGSAYSATPSPFYCSINKCTGCAFRVSSQCTINGYPNCIGSIRKDMKDIIWVKVA